MTLFENLKSSRGCKTSEELLHIPEPPDHQCDNISNTKHKASLVEEAMIIAIDYCKDGMAGDAETEIDYRLSEIKDIQNELEEFRETISSVRSWGQEWKDLAKSLLSNMTEEQLEEFMKYY